MRISGGPGQLGGRVGVTGPDREEVGRSWQRRVVVAAASLQVASEGWSLVSPTLWPARLSTPPQRTERAAARLLGAQAPRP